MSPASLVLAVGLSLSAADAPVSRPPATSAVPPVIEVHRTQFDVAFVGGPLAVSPSAPVVYALSGNHVFVLSASDGSILELLDLEDLLGERSDYWGMLLSVGDDGERLLLRKVGGSVLWSLSLADPLHPVIESEIPIPAGRVAGTLPGRAQALVIGYERGWERARLVDVTTGATFDFTSPGGPFANWGAAGIGGTRERPVVALYSYAGSYYPPTTRRFLSTYSAEDPFSPILLSEVALSDSPVGVLVDRRGETLVVAYRVQDDQGRFEVRDVATGTLLSSFEAPSRSYHALLSDVGADRVLVVADRAGVDLIDLVDPSRPVVRGRIDAGLSSASDLWNLRSQLAASATEPVLFVAASVDREVLSVDVRSGEVIGRWPAGAPAPVAIALGEGSGGRRDAAVLSSRIVGEEVLVPGGLSELALLDLANPASPKPRGHLARVLPTQVNGFVTVGGGYGVAADIWTNTIVLFRLSDGAVLDATGFHARFDETLYYYENMLQAAGATVLALSSDRYELFDVVSGRLVSRAREHLVPYSTIRTGTVRADGTAIVVTCKDLLTHLPDGRKGAVGLPVAPFPYPCDSDFRISPRGDLALVRARSYDDSQTFAVVVDLSDPAEPRLLWQGLPGYASGAFLEDGDRIFVTFGRRGFFFDTGLYDARTGAALGEPGDRVNKYYQHDIATAYGRGADARVVVWKWTYAGWETVLFDAGSGTPRLISTLPEFFTFPEYLPRDGGGWYELQWEPFTGPSLILVSDASGTQAEGLREERPVSWRLPRTLRRGFFATPERKVRKGGYGGYETPDIVLWRDTALNRHPVARPGGDRVIECDGRDGTPVILDGSASSDPDSTPGTSDDVASYAWTVDGAPAGSGPAVTASLGLGGHTALLTVVDLLGLSSSVEASVEVSDTLAPLVTLMLAPVLEGGRWTGQWEPQGSARDRCDGEIASVERLLLIPGSHVAPVGFQRSTARAVEVRRRKGELRVILLGPDEHEARALWAGVAGAGGFALTDGEPVGLAVPPSPAGTGSDLVTRYEVAEGGRLLRAMAFGSGNDLVVEASAMDAAGLTGSARVSVRESERALCATLPPGAGCPGI